MKRLSAKQRWIAIGGFAVMATGVTFALMLGPFRYASVCDKCGAIGYTTEWQVPLTQFTLLSYSAESGSALSRALLTNGIVQPHVHHWLFAQGGGNGVRCAIGDGRHIRAAAESEKFASLVLMLHQHGQIAFRDRVLKGGFDPETSHFYRVLDAWVPKPTATEADIQAWIAEQSEFLDVMVPANKRR